MTTQEINTVSNSYLNAFKSYSDAQIIQAADKYAETGEYFPPRPEAIISLITDIEIDKHTKELISRYTCRVCGMKASAITDGICLDCAGIPKPEYEKLKPLPDPGVKDCRIEGRVVCSLCGHIGMGINEPAGSEGWSCRKCYTGLNDDEIVKKFSELRVKVYARF